MIGHENSLPLVGQAGAASGEPHGAIVQLGRSARGVRIHVGKCGTELRSGRVTKMYRCLNLVQFRVIQFNENLSVERSAKKLGGAVF